MGYLRNPTTAIFNRDGDRLIARRTYPLDDDIVTDLLFMQSDKFTLVEGKTSQEDERRRQISADYARQWLGECPHQLTVYAAI